MKVFATWVEADQRFAFSPTAGERELTPAEHMALLQAESRGGQLRPDAVTGQPTVLDRPNLSLDEQLVQEHAAKVQELSAACEAAITSGFTSDALGTLHRYDSQLEDQINLTSALLNDQPTLYPCRDDSGAKQFLEHTPEQLRAVSSAFAAFKLKLLQQNNVLKEQADQALAGGELEALQAITWSLPQ